MTAFAPSLKAASLTAVMDCSDMAVSLGCIPEDEQLGSLMNRVQPIIALDERCLTLADGSLFIYFIIYLLAGTWGAISIIMERHEPQCDTKQNLV